MYGWMINHHYFGKVISGYRDYGLTMRMKWTAAVAITASLLASALFFTDNVWVRAILGVVGVYALIGISVFMSLMFPTIFGLGSQGLGTGTVRL